MTIHPLIRRPSFVVLDQFGAISELYCKICGSCIAATTSVIQGKTFSQTTKQWTEHITKEFRRNSKYAELKMEMEDGSAHVTHGCGKCLVDTLDKEIVQGLYDADVQQLGLPAAMTSMLQKKKVKHIIAIRTDGGGIP